MFKVSLYVGIHCEYVVHGNSLELKLQSRILQKGDICSFKPLLHARQSLRTVSHDEVWDSERTPAPRSMQIFLVHSQRIGSIGLIAQVCIVVYVDMYIYSRPQSASIPFVLVQFTTTTTVLQTMWPTVLEQSYTTSLSLLSSSSPSLYVIYVLYPRYFCDHHPPPPRATPATHNRNNNNNNGWTVCPPFYLPNVITFIV